MLHAYDKGNQKNGSQYHIKLARLR